MDKDWLASLNADSLPWLLEPDPVNPGVRYFALRDLLDRPAGDAEIVAAQEAVMASGPVPAILAEQAPEGYWVKPGAGYSPKYRGSVWSLLFLAQLGADGRDERVRRAAEYLLTHACTKQAAFSCNGQPSAVIHCLWGNMVRALLDLGYWGDERLAQSLDSLARSVTGDGYEAYRQSGLQGPGFACAANGGLPCAWGAVRALWALNGAPRSGRTAAVEAAIGACADFLLAFDVARAGYPASERISPRWFQFGYPLAYVTDLLLNLEVLAGAGYAGDSRLAGAVALVLSKQDERGRWKLEHDYKGKMWLDIEKKGRPSKWVTLRALRVLKMMGETSRL